MKQLELEIKKYFGRIRIYPANELALSVTNYLLNQKTLTIRNISEMKKLGYSFKVTSAPKDQEMLVERIEG